MVGSFSASFILLEKMSRSSSMSVNPAGGALRLEAWRMAGIFASFFPISVIPCLRFLEMVS